MKKVSITKLGKLKCNKCGTVYDNLVSHTLNYCPCCGEKIEATDLLHYWIFNDANKSKHKLANMPLIDYDTFSINSIYNEPANSLCTNERVEQAKEKVTKAFNKRLTVFNMYKPKMDEYNKAVETSFKDYDADAAWALISSMSEPLLIVESVDKEYVEACDELKRIMDDYSFTRLFTDTNLGDCFKLGQIYIKVTGKHSDGKWGKEGVYYFSCKAIIKPMEVLIDSYYATIRVLSLNVSPLSLQKAEKITAEEFDALLNNAIDKL